MAQRCWAKSFPQDIPVLYHPQIAVQYGGSESEQDRDKDAHRLSCKFAEKDTGTARQNSTSSGLLTTGSLNTRGRASQETS